MTFLNRITIGQKLMLLGFLVIAAISAPVYMQVVQTTSTISTARAGQEGLPKARTLLKLMQFTQQHRGLSNALLSGAKSVQQTRDAKQAQIDTVSQELEALLKVSAADEDKALSSVYSVWTDAAAQWRKLKEALASGTMSAAESTSGHTALIDRYFELLDLTLDQSGLLRDPSADVDHLVTATLVQLPAATEALGLMRARGAGFLAQGSIDAHGRGVMAALTQRAGGASKAMHVALDKALGANPSLRAALGKHAATLSQPVHEALELARTQVLVADTLKYPPAEYFAEISKSIDALFAFEEAALQSLDARLTERAQDARRSQLMQFGLLGAFLCCIALLTRQVVHAITGPLGQAVELAERVAAGDLTGDSNVMGRDEIATLMTALKRMQDSLHRVVGEVRTNAESVSTASVQIADGNSDLSRRTEQQAASLEQTAASMEELTCTVSLNAEHAREAAELARHARELALSGGSSVEEMVSTMKEIDAGSKKIAEIIGVIDGIAFQTNILALNAAVEAARAGEQGRGFAVVAGEVRSLAKRSAEAAKEIKSLITASVGTVNAGSKVVEQTGQTMREAVKAIQTVAESITQITQASQEQSVGLGQVNEAVAHMDRLTQQNASLVQASTSASDKLKNEARRLADLVKTFRLAADARPSI